MAKVLEYTDKDVEQQPRHKITLHQINQFCSSSNDAMYGHVEKVKACPVSVLEILYKGLLVSIKNGNSTRI